MENAVLEAISVRRSVRDFTDGDVSEEALNLILEAGRWAPSGLNNQPWRFVVVRGEAKRGELAGLTHYSRIIMSAPVCVAVFLDRESSYHEIKDAQAVGACLQNMLLAAHSLGLGAVWLGEILRNADGVRQALNLKTGLDLMAVVALGHPARRDQQSSRRPLEDLVLARM